MTCFLKFSSLVTFCIPFEEMSNPSWGGGGKTQKRRRLRGLGGKEEIKKKKRKKFI
jgi:hypothetical protein